MVWGYIKSRETARRMDAYAGEVQAMHPFYAFDSPARAKDMDLATTNAVSDILCNLHSRERSSTLQSLKPAFTLIKISVHEN